MAAFNKFSPFSRHAIILCSFFHPLKNEANKIDLLRERLKIILEGDGLVLANEVCIPYASFQEVILFQVSGSHTSWLKILLWCGYCLLAY